MNPCPPSSRFRPHGMKKNVMVRAGLVGTPGEYYVVVAPDGIQSGITAPAAYLEDRWVERWND